ncbi:MAG: EF-P beta-lysylation protein EpmB [Pirellulaceae bacterium]|nr:EF-P beta-lysylation protein EpmB [Pirellulaceae bacterium]
MTGGNQATGHSAVKIEPVGDWRSEMKQAIRDPLQLCSELDLPASWGREAERAAADFPLFVPRPYLRRIRAGDVDDPLLRQVLPLAAENDPVDGFSFDPVLDLQAERAPGVIQKYEGRALLVTTGSCAIHCRYCFRRHFPYAAAPQSYRQWQPAIDQLAEDRTIEELILSGGDPLTLVDTSLNELISQIAKIPHIRRLRLHTRLPVVIPSRITDELIRALMVNPSVVVVVHINHPHEIDGAVAAAIGRLIEAGAIVLNQAVLLRNVNDCAETLIELSQRLIELRVMPYYLNQLDRVAGAAHFEVSIERGQAIMDQLSRRLPGYAVPKYVQDSPEFAWKKRLA